MIFQLGTTLDLALLLGLNSFVGSIALLGCELAVKLPRVVPRAVSLNIGSYSIVY